MEQGSPLKIPMHQRVVAVVLPSPYKPVKCWRCSTLVPTLSPFCPECQVLQDLPVEGVNHFSILGLKEGLEIDPHKLRDNFYNLSKKTHPDRFVNVPAPEPMYAARWSSAINKAHQVLKDERKRTEYLLELYQVKPQAQSKVPTELAESYFELQDLLLDEEGEARMEEFKLELLGRIDATMVEWKAIAKDWELGADRTNLLTRLSDLLNRQRYMYSMVNDIDRKIGGTSGTRWN